MNTWHEIQDFFSLKGKFILTLFTLEIMALLVYSVYTGKLLPPGLTTVYSVAVGAYAGKKIATVIKGKLK